MTWGLLAPYVVVAVSPQGQVAYVRAIEAGGGRTRDIEEAEVFEKEADARRRANFLLTSWERRDLLGPNGYFASPMSKELARRIIGIPAMQLDDLRFDDGWTFKDTKKLREEARRRFKPSSGPDIKGDDGLPPS